MQCTLIVPVTQKATRTAAMLPCEYCEQSISRDGIVIVCPGTSEQRLTTPKKWQLFRVVLPKASKEL